MVPAAPFRPSAVLLVVNVQKKNRHGFLDLVPNLPVHPNHPQSEPIAAKGSVLGSGRLGKYFVDMRRPLRPLFALVVKEEQLAAILASEVRLPRGNNQGLRSMSRAWCF